MKKIKRTWKDDKKLIAELQKEKEKLLAQLQTPVNMVGTTNNSLSNSSQFIDLIKIDSPWRLRQFMEEFFAKGVKLAQRKNHDYAGNNDPFYNFRRYGFQGFIVRIEDKFCRLETLVTHGILAVTDESYTDTLIDIANYAALLAAFIYNQGIEAQEKNKLEQPR